MDFISICTCTCMWIAGLGIYMYAYGNRLVFQLGWFQGVQEVKIGEEKASCLLEVSSSQGVLIRGG